jgi:stearoyl-CoA desaturase (delta-9 desaturase)
MLLWLLIKTGLMSIFFVFIASWYLSLFGQSFFQHRYAAHGAFKMTKKWERTFFVITYLFQGTAYMSPRAYGIMHRMHHAYTDTPLDPHTPRYSRNLLQMMWRTRRFYRDILNDRMEVEERFTKNLPEWKSFDRWGDSIASTVLWLAVYATIFVFLAPNIWCWLLLPVIALSGAVHGSVINWFAHRYGYINFPLRNTAKNLLIVDFLMLGESYHNNHHKFPSAANFGVRWHEIDPIYLIILLFSKIGIIQMPDLTPRTAKLKAKQSRLAESNAGISSERPSRARAVTMP